MLYIFNSGLLCLSWMTLKKSSTLRYLSHIFDIGAAHNDFSILKVGVCVHGYIKPITLKVERIADIILLTFLILAGIGLSAFGLSILRGFLSCESSAIGASWNNFLVFIFFVAEFWCSLFPFKWKIHLKTFRVKLK